MVSESHRFYLQTNKLGKTRWSTLFSQIWEHQRFKVIHLNFNRGYKSDFDSSLTEKG